jgi:hypothetical protein
VGDEADGLALRQRIEQALDAMTALTRCVM